MERNTLNVLSLEECLELVERVPIDSWEGIIRGASTREHPPYRHTSEELGIKISLSESSQDRYNWASFFINQGAQNVDIIDIKDGSVIIWGLDRDASRNSVELASYDCREIGNIVTEIYNSRVRRPYVERIREFIRNG